MAGNKSQRCLLALLLELTTQTTLTNDDPPRHNVQQLSTYSSIFLFNPFNFYLLHLYVWGMPWHPLPVHVTNQSRIFQ